MTYWSDAELARFGYFELDGVRSPGVLAGIEVNGIPLKWDSQNGFGLSGEFLRFTGLGLSEFKFTLRLLDEDDRRNQDAPNWRRATAPPVQGQPDRIRSVRHPVLERFRPAVDRAVMLEVPAEVPGTTEGGGVIVTYPFKAYRKPLPQQGKPKAPKEVAKGKVQTPNDSFLGRLATAVKNEFDLGKIKK